MYEHPSNNKVFPTVSASIIKNKKTAVDQNTSFTLTFPSLDAQAILSCSINLPAQSNSAILRFRSGNIVIPAPLYCPRQYIVQYFDAPGSGTVIREEKVRADYVGGGWHFQADEVARCVRDGKLESTVWSHDKTLLAMTVFDEVRKQGGYKLPDGVEKVF